MRDTAGDGWSLNYFNGFGLRETMSGRSRQKPFTTACAPSAAPSSTDNSSSSTAAVSTVSSAVTVNGGSWKQEVRWTIKCGEDFFVTEENGRAPYNSIVSLPACTQCELRMRDTAGDGWSGNSFQGFGLIETITTGSTANQTFTTECAAPAASSSENVTSLVSVNGGTWKTEVRWNITCGGILQV